MTVTEHQDPHVALTPPSNWLGRATITTKLMAIVGVFTTVILLALALFAMAFSLATGIRAYVIGEGFWSKGQKDAVYLLSRYAQTRAENDYRNFRTAIAIPLGDRDARVEMEKPDFDHRIAKAGFLAGGNALDDIPYMIFLFRHFQDVPFLANAIRIWKEAEQQVLALETLGVTLHEQIRADVPAGELSGLIDQIAVINAAVTPLEQRFSQTLGEGARDIQSLLLLFIFIITAALMTIGLLFVWWISQQMHRSITGLRKGAIRVMQGDLSSFIEVQSHDELGDLTTVFNEMIARRYAAETALRAAHEFREKVMESATNAIYTMDPQGRFTTANRRTGEITGYPIEELIGKPWADLVPPEELPDMMARYIDTLNGGEPMINRETPVVRRDGRQVFITFSNAALSRDGTIFGVVGIAEDITERRRAETELKARAEELARSNRELEQFAYVASHDLQEPLRTVSGFAQLLAKRYSGQLGPEADEYIGFVTSGITRMKSLIEDLLAYSRVSREQQQLTPTDLEQVLATVLANLRGSTSAASATVTHDPLPVVRADQRQLSQLFQNLIGNAIKFRRDEAPSIHISAYRQGTEWHFTVCDNGIGIEPEAAEKIFGLFQRLHTLDRYAGNGIGLTICKKIVDLHHGRIWVEANPAGRGSAFHFTLPA